MGDRDRAVHRCDDRGAVIMADAGDAILRDQGPPNSDTAGVGPDRVGPDTSPIMPEVARFWPALLRGAVCVMDPDEPMTLFDVLPSKMKTADWQQFAIAAAFLVADMAHKLGATIDDLNDMATELRERAASETRT